MELSGEKPILICLILSTILEGIPLTSEDSKWNKFVNPYLNVTRISKTVWPSSNQPWAGGVGDGAMDAWGGLHTFTRSSQQEYKQSEQSARMTPLVNPFNKPPTSVVGTKMQLDSAYNPNSLLWSPSTSHPLKGEIPNWNSVKRAFMDSDETHSISPYNSPTHPQKMIWNEQGEFWGYGQRTEPYYDDGTGGRLWSYDAVDDRDCIPPFCIPVNCDEEIESRCRGKKPMKTVSCTEMQCDTPCVGQTRCASNATSACPSGTYGPQCTILNASLCEQLYSLHCMFGCTVNRNVSDLFKCVCDPWTGQDRTNSCVPAELDVFRCPLGCSGHGRCDNQTKQCVCNPGYTGQACERAQDCPPGLTGTECNLDIDECLSGHSKCEQRCVNTYGSFRCECFDGYTIHPHDPKRCEWITNCPSNCVPGQGVCDHQNRCICLPGFEGEWCTTDVDECKQGTHSCDQICVNTHGSYKCSCHVGYSPSSQNPNWCIPDQCQPSCVENQGTCGPDRRCSCNPGFEGVDCGKDVDECATGRHGCQQQCVNTFGSYHCLCEPGYIKDSVDQRRCVPDVCHPRCINESGECYGRSCMNGVCRVKYSEDGTPRTYCECYPGYGGVRCEHDIDECSATSDQRHQCSQICHNTPGSYYCACEAGYRLQSDNRTCVIEADLCGNRCMNGGTCTSSGQCQCPPQFEGLYCELRVNLCQKVKACEHHCFTERDGTFQCACQPGYQLASDGRSCVLSEGCPGECKNGGQCFRGRCLCKSGFEGTLCDQDKNECLLPAASHGCTFECQNTYGSYECICPMGYQRLTDKRTCVRSSVETSCNPPCRNGGVCRKGNRCDCLRGFKGVDCSEDINECAEFRPCDPDFGECHNTPGGFECMCRTGYRLMLDGRHCIDENRARHAPHLVFRGRGQKGIVVATRLPGRGGPHPDVSHERWDRALRTMRRRRDIQRTRKRSNEQKLIPHSSATSDRRLFSRQLTRRSLQGDLDLRGQSTHLIRFFRTIPV
ncbi:hypothetical protein P879_02081 [Paragonimus westermani]|uniref:EGF-like domain-containing protein n=1 Tax=Paragonimus westermani TaxID=34504 RepID=A0A8T0DJV8_9TREM|nr:hypothetical protein P879_02081 [Paragonimus westermani]